MGTAPCFPAIFTKGNSFHDFLFAFLVAGPHKAVGSASDKEPEVPGFIPGLLLLIQKGQLSVTGKSMCTKYWLTAWEV